MLLPMNYQIHSSLLSPSPRLLRFLAIVIFVALVLREVQQHEDKKLSLVQLISERRHHNLFILLLPEIKA